MSPQWLEAGPRRREGSKPGSDRAANASAGSEAQGWSRRATGVTGRVRAVPAHRALIPVCKGERDTVQDLRFEEGALATHLPSTGFPSRAWRPEMTHVPMLPLRVSEDWR